MTLAVYSTVYSVNSIYIITRADNRGGGEGIDNRLPPHEAGGGGGPADSSRPQAEDSAATEHEDSCQQSADEKTVEIIVETNGEPAENERGKVDEKIAVAAETETRGKEKNAVDSVEDAKQSALLESDKSDVVAEDSQDSEQGQPRDKNDDDIKRQASSLSDEEPMTMLLLLEGGTDESSDDGLRR